ncbi:MAG TPA: hypothetical protein VFV07_10265 [Rhizomicrobium sp.]|nr:hypothetical protein [Rhizomicrobium sp.]
MKPFSLCAIGNSHAATYHTAWKNAFARDLPHLTLTFFAANGSDLEHLAFEDGAFVARDEKLAAQLALTSGGAQRIAIQDYDAFLLIGLGVRINIRRLIEGFGTVEHRRWGEVETLISRACFTAMTQAVLNDNQAFRLLDRIRETGTQPALVLPTPYRSDAEAGWTFLRKHRRLADSAFRAKLIAQVEEIGTALVRRYGAEILWQDESTLGAPGFSKAEYAQNPERLGSTAVDDGMHMNEAYGRIMLTRALARLDEMSGGRVLGTGEGRTLLRA